MQSDNKTAVEAEEDAKMRIDNFLAGAGLMMMLLSLILYGSGFSVITLEDSLIYTDFSAGDGGCQTLTGDDRCESEISTTKVMQATGGEAKVENRDGKLFIHSQGDASASYTAKRDFRGGDIIVGFSSLVHTQGDKNFGTADIKYGDCTVSTRNSGVPDFSGRTPEGSNIAYRLDDSTVKIISSRLDPEHFEFWLDGRVICEGTRTDGILSFSTEGNVESATGNMLIDEIRYRLPFHQCELQAGDAFVFESFSGEQNIDVFLMRYPVKKFCTQAPAIVAKEEGVESTTEIYERLISGEIFSPDDFGFKSVGLFYITDSKSLPKNCDNIVEALDTTINSCRLRGDIITVCSTGIFDPDTGVCITGETPVCTIGRYDVREKACIYNPPVEQVCTEGTFDLNTGTCKKIVQEGEVGELPPCPEGYDRVVRDEQVICESTKAIIKCPSGEYIDGVCKEFVEGTIVDVKKDEKKIRLSLILGIAGAVMLLIWVIRKSRKK